DFDTLSLSNMNRMPASVADVGLPKCVIAARRMFEIDPYLEISIALDGARAGTIDDFLLREERLDLLVEECDDISIKVLARERAREHRIPVVMETNDRGMVDIERFDLEPERPIFHGLLAGVDSAELSRATAAEKVPFVLRLLGGRPLRPRTVASLLE